MYQGRQSFYGLAGFFWSDIEEPVPHELFQLNRSLLADTYAHLECATDYDLTASLNADDFTNEFTLQSVLAEVEPAEGRVWEVRLYPVSLGYGANLRTSGTPTPETRPEQVGIFFATLVKQTRVFGLLPPALRREDNVAVLRPQKAGAVWLVSSP